MSGMVNPYEGIHYWLAAAKYKLTHPGLRLVFISIKNGEQYPEPEGGYNLDRARLFYDADSKKTIEIKRG
jgi:hypothetical protein